MSARQLQDVLDAIADTGEIVIRPQPRQEADELLLAWRNARAEANALLDHWRAVRTGEAFAAFRAADDRADAAEDALAGSFSGPSARG